MIIYCNGGIKRKLEEPARTNPENQGLPLT
jgi:hypothetical protein